MPNSNQVIFDFLSEQLSKAVTKGRVAKAILHIFFAENPANFEEPSECSEMCLRNQMPLFSCLMSDSMIVIMQLTAIVNCYSNSNQAGMSVIHQ